MICAFERTEELAPSRRVYTYEAVVVRAGTSAVEDDFGEPERVPDVQRTHTARNAEIAYARVVGCAWVERLG